MCMFNDELVQLRNQRAYRVMTLDFQNGMVVGLKSPIKRGKMSQFLPGRTNFTSDAVPTINNERGYFAYQHKKSVVEDFLPSHYYILATVNLSGTAVHGEKNDSDDEGWRANKMKLLRLDVVDHTYSTGRYFGAINGREAAKALRKLYPGVQVRVVKK